MSATDKMNRTVSTTASRSEWMTVLALSQTGDLERHWREFDSHPKFAWIKKPELGTVLVRARASRTGCIFELGEMTITRCSVEIGGGIVGHAYVAGRNKRHAAIAAIFDALFQSSGDMKRRAEAVFVDLRSCLNARRGKVAAQAYASSVDFFMQLQEQA
ncbi:phosphonate C-P lyase system protein PhnG [Bradyrhizobium sp. SSUT77]|uniref:phosphonate C-P lyase system protein PhnG n=1 Tax=Bradyrhizobium sp. SSUT77 TaxID=3040603 RepID=UPI00244D4B88|nr:phosphonate C-P lyase system protein PhnG [Bradyrhizobium sp. SSUT77]MDH2347768.1 phosphonate C-P lyase system protein PhnG [Bradyrhizobium sp. SSUT77]